MIDATISIAFRFHLSLYHSYRGDSPDEMGIGKDLRVIRSILDDLDRLNDDGVPVRGTWDIENYYSLETYLPRHAPDIIDRIASRVATGRDEVEVMSYNNGVVAAHTEEELERAISWAITNPAGSGLADLFAEWAPIVRPQECMFTPSHLAVYRRLGIEAISLYYSALPFNAFSTFLAPLPFEQRYNPLTLASAACPETMTLLPAYNHGDIADHWASLRHWVRRMRRRQLAGPPSGPAGRPDAVPRDLMLLIDMDADDDFWSGLDLPMIPRLLPSFGGLARLVGSVADLPYLRFVRPNDYLRDHEPAGRVGIDRDTADGSYDGLSSWAEKWSNAEVWSAIDASRRITQAVARLAGEAAETGGRRVEAGAEELHRAMTERLLAMSTTHFGLASPVMNRSRLGDALRWAERSRRSAQEALSAVSGRLSGSTKGRRLLFDPEIDRLERGAGSLVTLGAGGEEGPGAGAVEAETTVITRNMFGERVRQAVMNPARSIAMAEATPGQRPARREQPAGSPAGPQIRSRKRIANGSLELEVLDDGRLAVSSGGSPLFAVAPPWVSYGGRRRRSRIQTVESAESGGVITEVLTGGEIDIGGSASVRWSRLSALAEGLPYLYIEEVVDYPETAPRGFNRAKAKRLGREWDARWKEIAPCEILPALNATAQGPATVWKHNYQDAVSSYRFDQHLFSANRRIASANNHITDGWVAVSDGRRGLLVAQSAARQSSFAFCPMRVRTGAHSQRINLNPFGTYSGPQLRYPTRATGLGRTMTLLMADHLDSYAPSYAGHRSRFSLMLAPYSGGRPPEGVQRDALLFATPPVGA